MRGSSGGAGVRPSLELSQLWRRDLRLCSVFVCFWRRCYPWSLLLLLVDLHRVGTQFIFGKHQMAAKDYVSYFINPRVGHM